MKMLLSGKRRVFPWVLPFAFIFSLFVHSSCDPEDDIDDLDLDLQLVADGLSSPIGLVQYPTIPTGFS